MERLVKQLTSSARGPETTTLLFSSPDPRLLPLVTRFRDPDEPYEDLIQCERDCMRCSYAYTLDCDGNCGACPRQTYCPCVNPAKVSGPRRPPGGRFPGRAPHGERGWTELRTRPCAWRASWPTRRCAFDLPAKESELAELNTRSGDPDLWNDPNAAQALLRRADELREEVATWRHGGARQRPGRDRRAGRGR